MQCVSAGLDASYTTVVPAFSPNEWRSTPPPRGASPWPRRAWSRSRYEWVPFSASSNLYLSVDGLEVQHHMAGQEGTGSHVYTRYVFLRAGKHTLGFSTGGDGSWVQCVSAGLDASYTTVVPAFSPNELAVNTASSRSFTLAKAGLVAICYEWVPFSASSNLYRSVDGLEVQHHMAGQEGTGSHVYTRYVFLRARQAHPRLQHRRRRQLGAVRERRDSMPATPPSYPPSRPTSWRLTPPPRGASPWPRRAWSRSATSGCPSRPARTST